jgi:small conductance mechanosensitive channel
MPITFAQEEPAAEETEAAVGTPLPAADPAKALTTQDPTIPLAELELLVKPLTLEELTNEAAAWMILLQAKAKEISNAEIAVKRQNLSIEKQNEAAAALDQAKTALAEAETAQADATPGSPAYQQATEKVEEAKANLAKAQQAVQESSTAKADLEDDDTLQAALEQSQKTGDLEAAKQVLEQARADRDDLTAGSTAYKDATAKIDALDEAIVALEAAQAAQAKIVPDTPEFQEAEAEVKAAQATLLEARGAIDGTQVDPEQAANQEAAEKVDEAAEQLETTEVAPDDAAGEDTAKQQENLETTIQALEGSSEVDAQVKEDLLVTVTNLQAEQTALIDRLNIVLREVTRKGGDVSPYEKYIQAITVITIDAQDTQGLAVRLWSWVRSEQGGIRWALNLGKFVGIILASVIVSRFLAKSADRTLQNVGNTSALFRDFTVMLIRRGGVVVGVLLALTALEVSLAPILAVVGGASFILAFALQSNLGNLASGLMLLVYKPFDVGDEVKVADLWGYVDSITLASTRLKGWAGQMYTLPNNTVWSSTIENLTANDIRKGSFTVRLPFDADLPRVTQVLLEIAKAHPLTLDDPAPGVFLWDYGDYTVNLLFGYWAKLDDFWTVWQDLHYQILERFPAENIEMPYPHQHIHLYQEGDDAIQPAHSQHDSALKGSLHPEGGAEGTLMAGEANGDPDGPE